MILGGHSLWAAACQFRRSVHPHSHSGCLSDGPEAQAPHSLLGGSGKGWAGEARRAPERGGVARICAARAPAPALRAPAQVVVVDTPFPLPLRPVPSGDPGPNTTFCFYTLPDMHCTATLTVNSSDSHVLLTMKNSKL